MDEICPAYIIAIITMSTALSPSKMVKMAGSDPVAIESFTN